MDNLFPTWIYFQWRDVQAQNPGVVIGVDLGSSFEFYDDAAEIVARVYEDTPSRRLFSDGGTYPTSIRVYSTSNLVKLVGAGLKVAVYNPYRVETHNASRLPENEN